MITGSKTQSLKIGPRTEQQKTGDLKKKKKKKSTHTDL